MSGNWKSGVGFCVVGVNVIAASQEALRLPHSNKFIHDPNPVFSRDFVLFSAFNGLRSNRTQWMGIAKSSIGTWELTNSQSIGRTITNRDHWDGEHPRITREVMPLFEIRV